MNPYSIALVDDDTAFLEDVKNCLLSAFQKADDKAEFITYSNPQNFLWDLQEGKRFYDVYILDVKMPGKNGFELAQEVRRAGLDVPILFLTDFQNEAINGYEVGARNYLLKDDGKERLTKILLGLYREWENGNRQYYIYHYNGLLRAVARKDIAYIQFDKPANRLMIAVGDEVLKERKSLKAVLSELQSEDFVLIAKGCAVNLTHVERIDGEWVVLRNKTTFSVTRKYKKEFMEKLEAYFRRMP